MNNLNSDFTLEKYRELLIFLRSKYSIIPVRDYCIKKPESDFLILRHDVDRGLQNAMKMAELENSMGIQATYYFRYPYTFDEKIIRKILAFNHEIGYHYEVFSKAGGDASRAIVLFKLELEKFRKICPVDTICMHGRPTSNLNNRDLWKHHRFEDYAVIGEAFQSIHDVTYFTDTGRSWASENNIRDWSTHFSTVNGLISTNDVMDYIRAAHPPHLYITAHPERWAYNLPNRIIGIARDTLFNSGKKLLRYCRS